MAHPSQSASTVLPRTLYPGNYSLDGNPQQKQYVFTQARLDIKLTFSVLIAVAAAGSFVGNLCVLRFTNNEEKKPVRARFSKLNYFVRSLVLSDVLGSLIGAPLAVIQMNFNVFTTKLPCIVSRFLQSVFIAITIYNLVIIGVERYICTCRPTSRPLSSRTVRKSVKGAWLLGLVVNLVEFSYPVEATSVYLNSTHYISTCECNYNDPTTRVILLVRALFTFILPTIILVFTCTSIMRMLRRKNQSIRNAQKNSKVLQKWCLWRRRARTQLISLIIAFIVPYSIYFAYIVFNSIFTPSNEFKTDYTVRAVATLLVYLNGSANFVIHLAQLNGFRHAIKGYLSRALGVTAKQMKCKQ